MDAAPETQRPLDPATLAPVAEAQRIEALDVVRGFALFGILLMNIEWFNRPFATFTDGMPHGLTGADWLASGFIAYFVQGKFWTIFALLFGMGFAVMLVRVERAGRGFVRLYLRRILALAVFGAVHFIYLWEGDILFSYAAGALALLIVLYGRAWPIVIACAVLVALGFIPGADALFRVAGGLATIGMLALYLRGEKRVAWGRVSMPLFCAILLLAGVLMSIAAVVLWMLPAGPVEPRLPLSVFGPLLLVTGWLAWRHHEPAAKRSLRMAVSIYVFAGIAMTAMGFVERYGPDPAAGTTPAAVKAKAEREKQLAELATRKTDEVRIFTTGTYLDTVGWRARRFVEKASRDAGFAVVLLAMFLLGVWFVRSGVMEDTARHLPLFRKLMRYGLPVGIGLGLLTAFIATSHTPGDRHDGWGIARGLVMLGNLPACLGYVGLVVTMLHSPTAWSRIRVLAPFGRMALTNYLMQSVVCMLFFYGFGLAHWGVPRAQQVLFVVLVVAAQVAFSHWWLARFRYGPMEWLWRGFTYRQVPPMRIGGTAPAAPSRAV